MKKIINKPGDFVEESIDGLIKSHPDVYAMAKDNDRVITRANKTSKKVGIVTGGGSGASGIVVVRYQIGSTQTSTAKASGGNISFYDGKTIHTFTSSVTFTAPGTFSETVELDLNFFRKKIINFESKKKTIKHTKKATKYPKLYVGCSDPMVNNKIKVDNKIKLRATDFFE